jgi:hypothetical protein
VVRECVLLLVISLGACAARPTGPATVSAPPRTAVATVSPIPIPIPTAPPLPTTLPSGVLGAFSTIMVDFEGASAMTLLFFDQTGVVTGIRSIIRDPWTEGISAAVAPDQGLEFGWGTGRCDPSARITFERAGGTGFRLVLDQEVGTGSCLAAEVLRDLVIELSDPIDPGRVEVVRDGQAVSEG